MIKTVWDRVCETDKPVLLYGTGNGADKIINELARFGKSVDGVFASDGFVRKRSFRGFPVLSYSEAKKLFGDFITLVAFGSSRKEVIDNIIAIANEHELYAVDVPVYGDNIFNKEFYSAHISEIEKVKNLFTDDESRRIYSDIINFKLSGNINYLFNAETTEKTEIYKHILHLGNEEIYVDLGAFNGDTIEEFLSFTNGYKKIYAVEPDKKNFSRLCLNTENLVDIERLNVCISDKNGTEFFSKHGGRNASAFLRETEIPCRTLDDILSGQSATYIKFDVEGFESRAIDGAKNTIAEFRPKMSIACYHRSEDIFSIPLKVISLNSSYKIHIRHFPYIPAWDTQFYFT